MKLYLALAKQGEVGSRAAGSTSLGVTRDGQARHGMTSADADTMLLSIEHAAKVIAQARVCDTSAP